MVACFERLIYINGVPFRDVTNLTVTGHIYILEEALALTQGRVVATSSVGSVPENYEDSSKGEQDPFWKQLPKYKKRKYRTKMTHKM
jgi:hypothetical protein